MALESLDELDKFKAAGRFLPGMPKNVRTFYSPVDHVHGALVELINSACFSIVGAMYGFDDDQLSQAILSKMQDENVVVQLTLDKSQAGGAKEVDVLGPWADELGNSVSVGTSEKSAIQHMKMLIIDGIDLVTGSTNWSGGGQTKQDNELTVVRDAVRCAEARARIDFVHLTQLAKMKGTA